MITDERLKELAGPIDEISWSPKKLLHEAREMAMRIADLIADRDLLRLNLIDMTRDSNRWKAAHDKDCPYVEQIANLEEQRDVLNAKNERLKWALEICLPVLVDEQEVRERSYLPEPRGEEARWLTEIGQAVDACKAALDDSAKDQAEDPRDLREQAAEFFIRAHYRLMGNPRFWYERDLIDASALLCVAASDLRDELRKAEA